MSEIPLNETTMRALRGAVNCRFVAVSVVLFFGWFFAFLSVFTQLDISEDQAEWFSRSGAVLTVTSLFATIWLSGIKPFLIGDGGYASREGIAVFKEIKRAQNVAFIATHISAAVGTVVWGYGNLFHRFLVGS